MILALDVGNTNIVIGGIDNEKIYFVSRVSTDRNKTADEYSIIFKNVIEMHCIDRNNITGAIISSVVPPLINTLKTAIQTVTKQKPLVVGPGVKTGLNITIDNPAQLGSDLVVGAVAALNEYKPPLIIIDMGTATTISVVDKKSNYVGGCIIPGVVLSQEALSNRTSQLPKISLDSPDRVIGRNTIDCMKSGLVYGNAAMIEGMVKRIEDELGDNATVIATGGLARSIVGHCNIDIIFDDNILLKGLWLIYDKNTR